MPARNETPFAPSTSASPVCGKCGRCSATLYRIFRSSPLSRTTGFCSPARATRESATASLPGPRRGPATTTFSPDARAIFPYGYLARFCMADAIDQSMVGGSIRGICGPRQTFPKRLGDFSTGLAIPTPMLTPTAQAFCGFLSRSHLYSRLRQGKPGGPAPRLAAPAAAGMGRPRRDAGNTRHNRGIRRPRESYSRHSFRSASAASGHPVGNDHGPPRCGRRTRRSHAPQRYTTHAVGELGCASTARSYMVKSGASPRAARRVFSRQKRYTRW